MLALLALSTVDSIFSTAHAQAAIPFDQIGAVAGKQYSGDGLAVTASADGARLHCAFQRLNADATTEGLWLASTADGAKGKPFRVMAQALGRANTESLPLSGKVGTAGQLVRFMRPGLTEEYSVGIDGLQQDFVIEQRPSGSGSVRLELEVCGAKAGAMAGGARLVLDDGGRQMVYDRLKAVDARGKELTVKMEVMSTSRLAVVLDDAAADYPVRIDPTFSDANWISLGGVPGVSGTVSAAVVNSAGKLYVGGYFTVAGNVPANCVAEWNGSSWSALGSGVSVNGAVYALAVSGTNLFAGGQFNTAGGVSATNIAKWNGSSWSPLGLGIGSSSDGIVRSLALSGTNLFVGGGFNTAGGVSATNIAKWNGSSWSALGLGLNSTVSALAMMGTNLYAGGYFSAAGGVSTGCIAQWNGSSWSALGSGISGFVFSLAVSGTNLFAGGYFSAAGAVSANDIAQWNGSSWSALGSGVNDGIPGQIYVNALAVSGTNLYAGGSFTTAGEVSANNIAQWNGSSWSAFGSGDFVLGMNEPVFSLAVSGTNLFVGGQFTTAGGVSANNIAQWNGSSWSALGSGMNGAVSALVVSGTNLFAGGQFTTAGNKVSANIAEANFTAPAIVSQPVSETLPIGDTANFAVSVTGYLPLDYQWYFNTNVANLLTPASFLPGATNVNPVSGPVIPNDMGNYQLIVTNAYGSATSIVATLTVLIEPNPYAVSNHSGGSSTTVYLASIPSSTNRLWATTNLSLPFSVIATNVADSNGLFQFFDPTTTGVNAKFYFLSMP